MDPEEHPHIHPTAILAALEGVSPPQCDCTFQPRFRQFDTEPVSAYEAFQIRDAECNRSRSAASQHALVFREWYTWVAATGHLPWVTFAAVQAYFTHLERKSIDQTGCPMNAGEFTNRLYGLVHLFEAQYVSAGYLISTGECGPAETQLLRCARHHLLQDPAKISQALLHEKQKHLDAGTNDKYFAEVMRTDEAFEITAQQARSVALSFLRTYETPGLRGCLGARGLDLWNKACVLGCRSDELVTASLWQLASMREAVFAGVPGTTQLPTWGFRVDRSKRNPKAKPESMFYTAHRDPISCPVWSEMLYWFQLYHIDGAAFPVLTAEDWPRDHPGMPLLAASLPVTHRMYARTHPALRMGPLPPHTHTHTHTHSVPEPDHGQQHLGHGGVHAARQGLRAERR